MKLGELDLHLAGEGRHERIYERLGAHVTEDGVAFAVWAPNARGVSVVGDWNLWDGRAQPLEPQGSSGIWAALVPEASEGDAYKFEVHGADGHLRLKSDPFAFHAEIPPKTASRIYRSRYEWADDDWLERRRSFDQLREPISVYEVHPGSWRLGLGWKELAEQLVAYAGDLGFTHVEFLPVMHHPFSGSWGYQVTGFYAPVSTLGEPDEFRALVDALHQAGIGVILDWVPAHFPRDEFALSRFDGTALYEHDDPRRGAHPDWGTLIFNLGRNEVRNFLLANALYWLREYPRRRAAGRCGRVDALPRLLAQAGRVGAERARRPGGSRGRLLPAGAERGRLRPRAGRDDDRGGVDRLAGRLAADLSRRPRLRAQVEHGLDARHARVRLQGACAPPLPPPRADVLDGLRLERELRPAALARRGRPRQAVTAREDARRPLAALREPARALRLHVGAPRQAAALHGRRVRAGEGVERAGEVARLAPARPGRPRRDARARPRSQLGLRGGTGAVAARPLARGLSLARAERSRRERARVRAPHRGREALGRRRLQLLAGRPRGLADRAAEGRHVAGGAEHGLALLRRLGRRQRARDREREDAVERAEAVGGDHAPAARRRLARAGRPVAV